jgi:hypothetical protein
MIKISKMDNFDGDVLRAALREAKISISEERNAIRDEADGFFTIEVDEKYQAKVQEIVNGF